jgi:hypothetical protein
MGCILLRSCMNASGVVSQVPDAAENALDGLNTAACKSIRKMYSAAPISANNDPYREALRQYNEERAEEAIAAAKAAAVAARAARPPSPPPPSEGRARRAINWLKRNVFCCCARSTTAVPPTPAEEPLNVVIPEPVTELPQGYFVGFDGKLAKPFNPNDSSSPCPHYLTTTNARTRVTTCLNCKAEV